MANDTVSSKDIAEGNVLYEVRSQRITLLKDGSPSQATTFVNERNHGVYTDYGEAEQMAALLNQKETPRGGIKTEYFMAYKKKDRCRGEDQSIGNTKMSDLARDAAGWAAYAYGLSHSGTPVENIEFEMKSMAAGTARSHGLTYFDSGIVPHIEEAEKEAAKYKYRPDVVVALIDGYQELIKAYKQSWNYSWAHLYKDDPMFKEYITPFTHHIKEHKNRIRQLEEILKK